MFSAFKTNDDIGRLEFNISNIDSSFVNGIRRSILSDVKTVAFEFDSLNPNKQDIKFAKNTCALHNEYLGERISLVPLMMTRDEIEKFNSDSWRFEMNVKSKPGDFRDVTSNDITIVNTGPSDIILDSKTVFPPNKATKDYILLSRLKPEKRGISEEIIMEAKATHGCGSKHARWSPVSHCVCVPQPDEDKIAIERAKTTDKNKFEAIDKKQLYVKRSFKFSIETCCGLTPKDIFSLGIEELQNRFRVLGEALSNKDETKISKVETKNGTDAFKFRDESDTTGSILQRWMFDKVDFVGYFNPHPMENSIIFVVKSEKDASEVIQDSCIEVSKKLDAMLTEWLKNM